VIFWLLDIFTIRQTSFSQLEKMKFKINYFGIRDNLYWLILASWFFKGEFVNRLLGLVKVYLAG
jgi:hypothetical protein